MLIRSTKSQMRVRKHPLSCCIAFRVGCAQLFLNYDDPLGNAVPSLHDVRDTFVNIELVAKWPWIPIGHHIL